jgi:hypothetical protein
MSIRWNYLIAPVLALVAAAAFVLPVHAAGGGDPGPAPFNVSAPTATIDRDDVVHLTFTVSCSDQAVSEAADVEIVGWVVRRRSNPDVVGYGSAVVTCAPGVQTIDIPIVGNGQGFRPGPATVTVEFHGCLSDRCIDALGSSDEMIRRVHRH